MADKTVTVFLSRYKIMIKCWRHDTTEICSFAFCWGLKSDLFLLLILLSPEIWTATFWTVRCLLFMTGWTTLRRCFTWWGIVLGMRARCLQDYGAVSRRMITVRVSDGNKCKLSPFLMKYIVKFSYNHNIFFPPGLSFKALRNIYRVVPQGHKFFDQNILDWVMWPLTNNRTLIHDSYWCTWKRWYGPQWRPFPTKVCDT